MSPGSCWAGWMELLTATVVGTKGRRSGGRVGFEQPAAKTRVKPTAKSREGIDTGDEERGGITRHILLSSMGTPWESGAQVPRNWTTLLLWKTPEHASWSSTTRLLFATCSSMGWARPAS